MMICNHERRSALPNTQTAKVTKIEAIKMRLFTFVIVIIALIALTKFAHCLQDQTKSASKHRHEPPPWSPYDLSHKRAARLCREARASGKPLDAGTEEMCHTWRYQYVDEANEQGNDVRILEKSLDERMANAIYTSISFKPVINDFFVINSGDPKVDEQNLRELTSAKTDDKLCGEQLTQMLALYEQLDARLDNKRQNSSYQLIVGEEHIRLARVLESFGRYESGFIMGRSHSLGAFDQCVTSRLLLQTAGTKSWSNVGTRFCWARLGLDGHLNEELKKRPIDDFESQEKVVTVGTCLPQACHTRSFMTKVAGEQARQNLALAQRLIDTQFHLPKALFIDQNLPIKSIYCLIDETSPFGLKLAGKLALAFIASWLALTIFATYYQEMRPNSHKLQLAGSNKKNDDEEPAIRLKTTTSRNFIDRHPQIQSIMQCLNLKRSWQDFVMEPHDEEKQKGVVIKERPADERVNLYILNPIKVVGCSFVVLGHSIIMQVCASMNSLRAYNTMENDPVILSMVVGTVVVDTFFVITGILSAYTIMQRATKLDKATGSNGHVSMLSTSNGVNGTQNKQLKQEHQGLQFVKQWANGIIFRHLRLLPLYFLVYWFKRSVYIDLFGRGKPLWDNGTSRHTFFGSCKKESWLTPFTMMTAYLPLARQCLPQAWSVANDLFFSITVTPIVILMYSRPKLAGALGILMGTISYSWTLSAYFGMPDHMATQLGHLRSHGFTLMFGPIHYLYTYPHFRLTSVIVGLLTGYVLHHCQENDKAVYLSWLRNWPTKLSFGVVLGLFISGINIPLLRPSMAPNEKIIFTHMFTTGRVLWAIANGIIFTRMATDWKDSYLMRQFSTKIWFKLTKLNFAILLLHMDVLLFVMGNAVANEDFTRQNIVVAYGFTYFLCLVLATIVHVIFENPINQLMRKHVAPRILF